jgi:hypothetical protein
MTEYGAVTATMEIKSERIKISPKFCLPQKNQKKKIGIQEMWNMNSLD